MLRRQKADPKYDDGLKQKQARFTGSEHRLEVDSSAELQQGNSIGETPFQPPLEQHLEMISSTHTGEPQTENAMQLQQAYGNQYFQYLSQSVNDQNKLQSPAEETTPISSESTLPAMSASRGLPGGNEEEEGILRGLELEMEDDNPYVDEDEPLTDVSISTSTNSGPWWGEDAQFDWRVGFITSGQRGWIIQEIHNDYQCQDAEGNEAGHPELSLWWESWAVDNQGRVTPNVGSNNDYWQNGSEDPDTQGHWSTQAYVYFTRTDPLQQGFRARGVPNAGMLVATNSEPSDLGILCLERFADGTWDSTGEEKIHYGTAE